WKFVSASSSLPEERTSLCPRWPRLNRAFVRSHPLRRYTRASSPASGGRGACDGVRSGFLPLAAVRPVDRLTVCRDHAQHIPGWTGADGDCAGQLRSPLIAFVILYIEPISVLRDGESLAGPLADLRIRS